MFPYLFPAINPYFEIPLHYNNHNSHFFLSMHTFPLEYFSVSWWFQWLPIYGFMYRDLVMATAVIIIVGWFISLLLWRENW